MDLRPGRRQGSHAGSITVRLGDICDATGRDRRATGRGTAVASAKCRRNGDELLVNPDARGNHEEFDTDANVSLGQRLPLLAQTVRLRRRRRAHVRPLAEPSRPKGAAHQPHADGWRPQRLRQPDFTAVAGTGGGNWVALIGHDPLPDKLIPGDGDPVGGRGLRFPRTASRRRTRPQGIQFQNGEPLNPPPSRSLTTSSGVPSIPAPRSSGADGPPRSRALGHRAAYAIDE
jgi:hypothetical protein